MNRVILHWTAGTNVVSAVDRRHYHRIVDGEGVVFAGVWPIEANERIWPGPVRYAAHALNCNTGSIGVALAGMLGARENPFSAGLHPINQIQLRAAARLVAELCGRYGIPVTPRTVLTHAELEPTLGIAQRGKWDMTRLPWRPDLVGHRAVGDHIRALVAAEMRPPLPPPPLPREPVVAGGVPSLPSMFIAALRGLFRRT